MALQLLSYDCAISSALFCGFLDFSFGQLLEIKIMFAMNRGRGELCRVHIRLKLFVSNGFLCI